MYRTVLSAICLVIILMRAALVNSAPTKARLRRDVMSESGHSEDSLLSVILNTENKNLHGSGNHALSRHKRDVRHVSSASESEVRRERRSAAWMLAAVINMCDNRPALCRAVTIQRGEIVITARVSDE